MECCRPIPEGRDRLGILGKKFGIAAALSGTDSEFAVHLKDFMAEWIGYAPEIGTGYYISLSEDTGKIYFYTTSTGRIALTIGGTTVQSDVLDPIVSESGLLHCIVFGKRDGNAYFFASGVEAGLDSIAAESTTDINSDTVKIGGRQTSGSVPIEIQALARLFVIDSADFPNDTQRKAIVKERFLDPDNESPTIIDLGLDGAAKRLDVDLVDANQDGATVPNNGAGGDPTIGSGLLWRQVRTQAERAAIAIPNENWFCFDKTHNAIGTADIGCAQGSYIAELIYCDIDYHFGLSAARLFYMFNAGATERFYLDITSPAYSLICTTNGVPHVVNLQQAGSSRYGIHGIHIVHFVYDADTNQYKPIVNGQVLKTVAVTADLNLSGNVSTQFGIATRRDGLMGLRLWNWDSLPLGWENEIYRRVINPWEGSELYGKTKDDGLKGEWLGKAGAQSVSATSVKNQVQPGTGDLPISGGDTWGESRVLAVAAR